MKSRSIVKFFSLVLAIITLVGTAVIPVFADNGSAAILPDSTQAAPYLPATVNPQAFDKLKAEHSSLYASSEIAENSNLKLR